MYIDGHNVRCKKEEGKMNNIYIYIYIYIYKSNPDDFAQHKTIPIVTKLIFI